MPEVARPQVFKRRHLHKDLFAQSGSKVYRGTEYGSRAYADQAGPSSRDEPGTDRCRSSLNSTDGEVAL
jgi:hypothetical protein